MGKGAHRAGDQQYLQEAVLGASTAVHLVVESTVWPCVLSTALQAGGSSEKISMASVPSRVFLLSGEETHNPSLGGEGSVAHSVAGGGTPPRVERKLIKFVSVK